VLVDLEAELEGDAAEHQRDEHDEQRQVEGRQERGVGEREGAEQAGSAQHQPGLVEIPDRRDRVHGRIALALVPEPREQDA